MQWTKKLTALLKYIVIAYIVLTPQRNYSQFSDSTIHEINKRLIECIECQEKLTLYQQLSHNDSVLLSKQQSTINDLIDDNQHQKRAKSTYQKLSAFSSILLLLAIIL